jgi:hypothetical protein
MRKVKVYLNDGPNHWFGYNPGDPLREVYKTELDRAEPDNVLLEYMFRVLNIEHPVDYRERSLSVGDVVTIDGHAYVCDVLGWKAITMPAVDFTEAEARENARDAFRESVDVNELHDDEPSEPLYPLLLYVYNEEGRYREPTRIYNKVDLEAAFKSQLVHLVRKGREIRITDTGDRMVFWARKTHIRYNGKEKHVCDICRD